MSEYRKMPDLYERILGELSKSVIGKDNIKEALMLALVAGGHVLIEGLPGTAKTKLARSFAEVIGGKYNRIQCTPDMMPADITGFYVHSMTEESRFVEGPIFANVLLADELNRTTPRTQSALLEAMQEYQVTIEKETFPLEPPFIVIATEVQSGAEGTYMLTDVQVDRFLLRILNEHSPKKEEQQVIANIDQIDEADIKKVVTPKEILELQQLAKKTYVSPDIVEYITTIVDNIRVDPDVQTGPSIRGGIAMYKCARVLALMDERDFVIPDDIKHLVYLTMEHRIRIKPEPEMDDVTPGAIIERTIEQIPVPKPEI